MKTILVPVDFSDATEPVLGAASEMARALNARVVCVSVIAPPVVVDEFSTYTEELLIEEEGEYKQKLEAVRQRLTAQGIETSARRLFGLASRELIAETRRTKPDLIVVGSHGHGALHNLLLGSTSAYLLRHANCPVLVVPVGIRPSENSTGHHAAADDQSRLVHG